MTEGPATERGGLFLTFEGMDGSGKSTQLRLLAQRLLEQGHEVLETAEPGGTPIGSQIRRVLLDARNQELAPTAELLLYFACRAQNVEQWIFPALRRGAVVLSDRFTDSTLAYQGGARGPGRDLVLTLDRVACHGLKPDRTLLIDIDLETSLSRTRERHAQHVAAGHAGDRMDLQAAAFHRDVREAYHAIAADEPERVQVVDGRGSILEVSERVWRVVAPLLPKRPE